MNDEMNDEDRAGYAELNTDESSTVEDDGDDAGDDAAEADGADDSTSKLTDSVGERPPSSPTDEVAGARARRGRKPAAAKEAKAPKAKGKKPKAGQVVHEVPPALKVPKGKGARSGKQPKLPGTENPDRIDALEALAARYVDVRDERMGLTKKEVEAKTLLAEEMKKRGLTKYACDTDDLDVVILPAKEGKLKVIRRDEADAGGDDE